MVLWKGKLARALLMLGVLGLASPACGGDDGKDRDDGEAGEAGDGGSAGTSGATSGGASGAGTSGAGTSGAGTSGASGSGGGGSMDPAFDAFCRQVRAVNVGLYERCNGIAPAIAEHLVAVDVCRAWAPSLAEGRMTFDATNVTSCIAALEALPCDADSLPQGCQAVLSGRRAPGEKCRFAAESLGFSECEVGVACVGELLGMTGCEGTCVARGLIGAACSGVQPCVSGETCTVSNGCQPRGSEGSPCGLDSSPICAEGLHCDDLTGGTCSAAIPVGGTCRGLALECAPPGICDRGADLTGTCAVPKKPGDPCVLDDFECSTGLSYCGNDGVCHADPGIDEPCMLDDGESTSCLVGTCDTSLTVPVCKPSPPGGYCASSADCQPGSICLEGLNPRCSEVCY
jgi:hypothetical protein